MTVRVRRLFVYGTLDPAAGTRMGDWIAARLMGAEPARATVTFAGERCPLDARTHLALDGRAHAEFSTDWSLSFDGRAAAKVVAGNDRPWPVYTTVGPY